MMGTDIGMNPKGMSVRHIPKGVMELMEKLDFVTYSHSCRVWQMAAGIEESMGMGDGVLSASAFVHDIGKYYIPASILDKRGSLTPLEREIIDLHPYIGYCILDGAGVCEEVKHTVLCHHGMQPKTLKPLPAWQGRVEELAGMLKTLDVFEALTADRPYRRGITKEQAYAFMEQGAYHADVLRCLQTVENMWGKEKTGISGNGQAPY